MNEDTNRKLYQLEVYTMSFSPHKHSNSRVKIVLEVAVQTTFFVRQSLALFLQHLLSFASIPFTILSSFSTKLSVSDLLLLNCSICDGRQCRYQIQCNNGSRMAEWTECRAEQVMVNTVSHRDNR